jgi:putative thiamine transport system substrate-binding protein
MPASYLPFARRNPLASGVPDRASLSRRAVFSGALTLGFAGRVNAAGPDNARGDDAGWDDAGWEQILRDGRGQAVAFHAWGGDERTNAFIAWTARRVRAIYGIDLRQVKLPDIADAAAAIAAELAVGKTSGGAVDLLWVDGATLLTMRQGRLLAGPLLDLLPAARLIARADKPVTVVDRSVPLAGYGIPWRLGQLVFIHYADTTPNPPRTIPALLDWARVHPGRLSHLDVRTRLGTAFLEQALYELVADPQLLQEQVTPARFANASAPFWTWYGQLRPLLWQQGQNFPDTQASQLALMKAGQVDLIASLNPSEAAMAAATGALAKSARAYVPERGSIGCCSFLAVPFNAAHRAGALLVANFLLSPEAQARGSDPRYAGAPSVLAMDRLSPEDYVFFDAVPRVADLLSDAERGPPLPEPHISWTSQLIAGWEQRYGS